MQENNMKQYNEPYDDSDDFDIEAKRAQWAQEREELRAETRAMRKQEARKAEGHLPFTMIALFICFVILVLISQETLTDITMNYGNRHGRNTVFMLFLTVWFGSIADLIAVVLFLKKRELLKSAIQITVCAVLYIAVMMFSYTNLPEAAAVNVYHVSKLFAAAGAAFTIYPIKYAWTMRKQNNTNE